MISNITGAGERPTGWSAYYHYGRPDPNSSGRAADSFTAAIQDARINHCGVYVAVPEQLLNRANIVAILK
jgi:hypothetical protein